MYLNTFDKNNQYFNPWYRSSSGSSELSLLLFVSLTCATNSGCLDFAVSFLTCSYNSVFISVSVRKYTCTLNTCQNGATCVEDGVDVICKCQDDFRGKFCEGLLQGSHGIHLNNEKEICLIYPKSCNSYRILPLRKITNQNQIFFFYKQIRFINLAL